MAKKSKKQRKREQRDRDIVEADAAHDVALRRQRMLRIAAAVVPLVTLAVSLSIYFSTEDTQLAALVGMVGLAIWVPVLLGVVGGNVKPRDRTRAGSIDFGNRR